jgi:ABC-type multidrug transport system fused ATPase/permease subunit
VRIFLGFLGLLLDIALELSPGFVWLYIIDHVVVARDLSGLPKAIGALVAISFSEALVSRFRRIWLEETGQGFVFDLRNDLFAKLSRLPLAYFNESRTGDLMSRVSSDVESVQEVVVNGTDTLLANLLRLLGVVVIFCSLNLKLGLATVAPIFVVGLLLSFFNKRVRGLYKAARERLGAINARLNDSLSGIRVVKGFAREDEERTLFRKANELFLESNLGAIRARANVFPWIGFVVSFTNTIMLAYGAWLIVQGQFTIGGLVAYRTYGRFFYGPIDNLTQINDMLQRAVAAGRRIFEVMDTPETVSDAPDAVDLPPIRGEIAFEDVRFAYYTAQGTEVLHEISFRLQPGQKVALVGESGAGKSTVFALLARFWDPTSGRITIDGYDLRKVTQRSLRRQVVSVQQDTFLFAASVAENIRYGRPEATQAEVEEAAKAANAHGFIGELPQGYETIVGERGVKLSGGQRQRIAVARAFLAGGSLVLLDEATSAVEPESERLIYDSLERLLEGRTAVVATHRLSTVRDANLILVLSKGSVVERGTHEELMRLGGRYAAMVADSERAAA